MQLQSSYIFLPNPYSKNPSQWEDENGVLYIETGHSVHDYIEKTFPNMVIKVIDGIFLQYEYSASLETDEKSVSFTIVSQKVADKNTEYWEEVMSDISSRIHELVAKFREALSPSMQGFRDIIKATSLCYGENLQGTIEAITSVSYLSFCSLDLKSLSGTFSARYSTGSFFLHVRFLLLHTERRSRSRISRRALFRLHFTPYRRFAFLIRCHGQLTPPSA